jgi:hypothetical protein
MPERGTSCENGKVRESSFECHQVGLTWEEYYLSNF